MGCRYQFAILKRARWVGRLPRRKLQNSSKNLFFPVDDLRDWDILAIPPEAGLHQSRDRRSWFTQFMGLQIGTQFCPGMMIEKPVTAGRLKIIVGARVEFF